MSEAGYTKKITDAGSPVEMQPLTCTRSLAQCMVANKPLGELQKRQLEKVTVDIDITLNGAAWVCDATLVKLAAATTATAVKDKAGNTLAWAKCDDPQSAEKTINAGDGDLYLKYPWDLLRLNELLLANLQGDEINFEGVHVNGNVVVGEGSVLLPGVYIEGNVLIGKNSKIGPNCYIRGFTTIGDGCHIGNAVEVKNSILYDGASVGHLSYCGDTILGNKVNFGAGTITSNFRHDGKNHRSMVCGELLDTGRRKFGSIMGDNVHTGINTSMYPGRKIWANCSTLPGAVVKYDITE